MIKIYLTNLGKYNEGELIGEWVDLPISKEELETVKERIGINERYEEYFISDYETDIDGLTIGEYANIEELNEIAEQFNDLDEYQLLCLKALLENGAEPEEAINQIDDCMVYYDCSDMTEVAEAYCEESGILNSIPENLRYYFDFEAFGRDMSIEGTFIFIDNDCVQIF